MNVNNMTLAGQITRITETKVDQRTIKTGETLAFGQAVMLDGDGISLCQTATSLFGILARGTNEDLTAGVHPVVTRGFISVAVPTGTPVAGGTVFLRTVDNGTKKKGDFETAAVVGETVELPKAKIIFSTNGKNAHNLAEIEVM